MTTISQTIGEELDKQARRDRDYLPQPHDREVQQGGTDELRIPFRLEVEPLDYTIADKNIGDIQHLLIRRSDRFTSEVFGVLFRELAKLRGKLRAEREATFQTKGKA